MTPPSESESPDPLMLTRREALRRAALVLGVAITPSFITGVLGAQTPSKSGYAPAYLLPQQFATAAAIAERILPRTDTPGAADVGVPAFIDLMYGKYMTNEEQSVFAAGLAEVETASTSINQRGFVELTAGQRDRVLTTIAAAAQDKEKTFFHLIKELTLLGYFTTELIGKDVLHYDPIPGRYDGCIPLAEVGNVSWTR
jgi:hypothetical protein